MPPKWRDVERALRTQGFELRPTKSGVMILGAKGPPVNVHRDPSPAAIREMLRLLTSCCGFEWPREKER